MLRPNFLDSPFPQGGVDTDRLVQQCLLEKITGLQPDETREEVRLFFSALVTRVKGWGSGSPTPTV